MPPEAGKQPLDTAKSAPEPPLSGITLIKTRNVALCLRRCHRISYLRRASLKEARERHSDARKALANGIDPMAERKAEGEAKQKEVEARQREAENSFENVAREWWKWWKIGKSPRHADTTMRPLERVSICKRDAHV